MMSYAVIYHLPHKYTQTALCAVHGVENYYWNHKCWWAKNWKFIVLFFEYRKTYLLELVEVLVTFLEV